MPTWIPPFMISNKSCRKRFFESKTNAQDQKRAVSIAVTSSPRARLLYLDVREAILDNRKETDLHL